MMKVKNLLTGMLAVLAVLLLTGCWEKDNPSRTSLDVDTSTLTLSVGETAVRMATSKAEDAAITYTSSNPAVATVDQFGKVTAMSEGSATITIDMAETKKSWYAAKTITYEVVVKNVSAKALVNVDKATPLTLVAQADGKITVTFNNGITLANDIKYTINNGAEQTIAKNTSGAYDITVKKGDVVQLYSLNTSLGGGAVAGARGTTRAVDSGAKYINIRPSMKTEIYGNVMSLLKGKDNLESATALEAKNAFYGLFAGAEKLVNNAERLLVLPATTLTEGCYQDMFNGCKGIEKAPELPAPKLEKNCYQEMFYDCAKLNHVKCLATDIKAENSTKDWLGKAGTEATGEKVLESVVDMTKNSDDGVPTSWMAQKLVTGIKLNKTELKLFEGTSETLVATVEPSEATDKTVTWTSDKPEVATVDANGKVTAVAEGEATITAQAGDKTATCKVTITKKTPATVTTAPTAITGIKAGEDKAIVTEGVADGGTMMYAVTNTNTQPTSTDGFSATVPKANDLTAGTYYVWYYVKADDTHVDSEISASGIEVTVAVAYTLLSAATASDVGKVVCAAGHLHTAKTAVPTGCTAVGILGSVTSTGHGLILALQDASNQEQDIINGWTSVTTYASTTLKLLPDNTARGSLASYTTLGTTTTVSNWCVAPKDDYVAIFTNLGSTTGNPKTYDDNVNAYITTGVGGSAMVSGDGSDPFYYWSTTPGTSGYYGCAFYNVGWYDSNGYAFVEKVRPVLGF